MGNTFVLCLGTFFLYDIQYSSTILVVCSGDLAVVVLFIFINISLVRYALNIYLLSNYREKITLYKRKNKN